MAPGAVHDVVIGPKPAASPCAARRLAEVRSLCRGRGTVGEVVKLDLNGGTTRTGAVYGSWLAAQSVLTGSGRLSRSARLVD